MIDRVFVYGTLQPGQCRWSILAPYVVQSDAQSEIAARGKLYDTGYGWPAAVFDADAVEDVPGVVLALKPVSLDEAIATLDAVEGADSDLFRRIVVDIGGQRCWAYQWSGSTEGFRDIACWPVDRTE